MSDFGSKDSFSSTDIQERIEELEELKDLYYEDDPSDPSADFEDELEELEEFREDVGENVGWGDGITFIADAYFKTYARELAEDTSEVDFTIWPANCINWAEAAEELQCGYSSISFGGEDFLYLGC